MTNNELSKDLEFATQLCLESGKILLDFFHQNNFHPTRKTDRSLVTEADLAVDIFIRNSISQSYPQDYLISEELNPQFKNNPSVSGWIIDPLDGTTNFVLGLVHWGILITRIIDGYPVISVQYFPLLDELYQTAIGSLPTLNQRPIRVEKEGDLSTLTIFSCCSRTFRDYQVNLRYKTRIFGSAGYSLSSVARGVARDAFEATAKIWDLAAAWVLIPQAGGVIGVIHGEQPFPIQNDLDYQTKDYPVIASASELWFNEALNKIKIKE